MKRVKHRNAQFENIAHLRAVHAAAGPGYVIITDLGHPEVRQSAH